MGKLDFIGKLRAMASSLLSMITENVGQYIDVEGNVTTDSEENRPDNIIPIDTVGDVVHIAEDLAAYYYLLKRLRKVSKPDIKAELQSNFDDLLDEIWTTYGLDEQLIDDAREYIAEFSQIRETVENFLESIF